MVNGGLKMKTLHLKELVEKYKRGTLDGLTTSYAYKSSRKSHYITLKNNKLYIPRHIVEQTDIQSKDRIVVKYNSEIIIIFKDKDGKDGGHVIHSYKDGHGFFLSCTSLYRKLDSPDRKCPYLVDDNKIFVDIKNPFF